MSNWSSLLPPNFKETIKSWIDDDCPSFDVGGFVVGEKAEKAILYCKSSGVLAGLPFAQAVFDYLQLEVNWFVEEGVYVEVTESEKVPIASVHGACRNILLAERTALNIITRASGVATESRKANEIVKKNDWHGFMAGTR